MGYGYLAFHRNTWRNDVTLYYTTLRYRKYSSTFRQRKARSSISQFSGQINERDCKTEQFSTTAREEREIYQRKKGSQQARNADTMIPNVLAAFRSLLILLLLVIGGSSGCGSGDDCSTVGSVVKPAEIPLICRCLFKSAAATLLLQPNVPTSYFCRYASLENKIREQCVAILSVKSVPSE